MHQPKFGLAGADVGSANPLDHQSLARLLTSRSPVNKTVLPAPAEIDLVDSEILYRGSGIEGYGLEPRAPRRSTHSKLGQCVEILNGRRETSWLTPPGHSGGAVERNQITSWTGAQSV